MLEIAVFSVLVTDETGTGTVLFSSVALMSEKVPVFDSPVDVLVMVFFGYMYTRMIQVR